MKTHKLSKTKLFIFSFIYGLIYSLVIGIIIFLGMFYFTKTPIQENNIVYLQEGEDIYKIINEVIINVSDKHIFKRGIYDCSDFSKDVVKELKSKGINGYCVSGYMNPYKVKPTILDKLKKLHTWVEVDINGEIMGIESTGGYMIPKEIYQISYIPHKKGYCL